MDVFVPLSGGGHMVVDLADYDLVKPFNWIRFQVNKGSAYGHAWVGGRAEYAHRLILSPPAKMVVDHINGDGLDNRRSNMRIATRTQNNANRKHGSSRTGYKGVAPESGKFYAYIGAPPGSRSKVERLGYFSTPEDAARVYDRAAIERWGEFARLNFPSAEA